MVSMISSEPKTSDITVANTTIVATFLYPTRFTFLSLTAVTFGHKILPKRTSLSYKRILDQTITIFPFFIAKITNRTH
jgi:hypothetical protein